MVKKIHLTETELTKIINKVIKEQTLPRHIRKGSKEHADWVRSQQGGDKDEILENLLTEAQRLIRFVENERNMAGRGNTDLSSILKNITTNITNYLNPEIE